jgi:hypothetical protein
MIKAILPEMVAELMLRTSGVKKWTKYAIEKNQKESE